MAELRAYDRVEMQPAEALQFAIRVFRHRADKLRSGGLRTRAVVARIRQYEAAAAALDALAKDPA